jgi:nucleotide-binding universal stress UspA family protein
MSMFNRLLVAFDDSPPAWRALGEAIELAQAGHGQLTVMAVMPDSSPWLGSAAALPMERGGLDAPPEAEFQAMLGRALRSVPADVPAAGILVRGPASLALVAEARTGDHDAIVIGSRGRGELRSMLLGSVSHAVLRESPIPVVVVRDGLERGREIEPAAGLAA